MSIDDFSGFSGVLSVEVEDLVVVKLRNTDMYAEVILLTSASLEGQFFNPRALKKRFHEIRQLHNLKPCHFPPIQQRIYPRKNETS